MCGSPLARFHGIGQASIRRFKSIGSPTRKSQLSATRDPAIDAPLALSSTECVLQVSGNVAAQLNVAESLQLDRDCHQTSILCKTYCPPVVQKRSTPRRTGLLIHRKQPYPQFMLKIEQVEEGKLRALPSSELYRSGRWN